MSYSAEKQFNLRKKFGFGDWDDSFDTPEADLETVTLRVGTKPDGSRIFETVELGDDFNENLDEEPENTSKFRHGDMRLVGHGKQTNSKCGTFSSYYGCARVELHDKITLDGVNYKGKVYVCKILHSCDKPDCPVCYKYGWASRAARKIENRLNEASKRFGLVEHIIATVPPKFYGLDYISLRVKIKEILAARGVIGGVMIFHGFRYNKRKSWYWSPHFHVLGFILGGYKCRSCKKVRETGKCGIENRGCDGFVNRNYRMYEKDGCIVKVKGKRITVGGTAWYQLNHASINVRKKRFHVAVWFGVCSYRKLKVTDEVKKNVCPICLHELKRLDYFGDKTFVLDKDSPDFRRVSFEDLMEDGRIVWFEREEKEW